MDQEKKSLISNLVFLLKEYELPVHEMQESLPEYRYQSFNSLERTLMPFNVNQYEEILDWINTRSTENPLESGLSEICPPGSIYNLRKTKFYDVFSYN